MTLGLAALLVFEVSTVIVSVAVICHEVRKFWKGYRNAD